MVHPDLVMEAFSQGADGVVIMGCHPGECHYLEGNTKAAVRAKVISVILQDIGVDPNRFELKWISSAEGSVFAQLITDFTMRIKKLGPHKVKSCEYRDRETIR
jgi:coenzyme F420-reducing hydrogenase delta subunit